MDYDMVHLLYPDAWPIGDRHLGPPPVDGLEAVHEELALKSNDHVLLEDYPQRLCLDGTVAEGAWLRVRGVVGGVGDRIDCSIFPSQRTLAKAHSAVGQEFTVGCPSRIATPTSIDLVHDLLTVMGLRVAGGGVVACRRVKRDESQRKE